MNASLIIIGIVLISAIYFFRGSVPAEFQNWFPIIGGTLLGLILNISLSTEFLSEPSYFSLAGGSFMASVLLVLSFTLIKDVSWHRKLAFVFLGCWIISLIFAIFGFIRTFKSWLQWGWIEEARGGPILIIRPSFIVDLLKSLFLSSLFNVLERITRLLGEKRGGNARE